jgi:hypothetical protein
MLILPALFLAFPLLQTVSPQTAQPPVSTDLEPLASKVVYQLQGRGDQIYVCAQESDGMKWVLKAPAAVLYDASNQPVGKHGYGPRWTWKDGSALIGKVVGRRAAPSSTDIPWLLVKTDPFTGPNNGESDPPGALDAITYVKRSNTQGGLAPASGCDAANIGASQAVPYSATYTFYTPAP